MDLSSIEQIIRTRVPNAPDSEVELYLDSVQRDMKFGGDYSDMSEDDIVEDFEFYIQSKMDEAQKPSMKMKKSELKEMIKAAFLSEADFTNAQDDDAALGGMYDPVYEGEDEEESLDDILARVMGTKADPYMAEDLNEQDEEEETDIEVDAEEEVEDEGGEEEETSNDSIVVDKKIVSLSSLPQETRKILDTLETLRAQAEEFGDQKFITQVGNTITFFTRDFVVAGDEPTKAKVDESLEILKMKKLAGLLTEGEYAKALLKEYGEPAFDNASGLPPDFAQAQYDYEMEKSRDPFEPQKMTSIKDDDALFLKKYHDILMKVGGQDLAGDFKDIFNKAKTFKSTLDFIKNDLSILAQDDKDQVNDIKQALNQYSGINL